MKTRIYLRIAKKARGVAVKASTKPSFAPLESGAYIGNTYYPTVLVALELDIPDKEFDAARILLQTKISEATPAVEIKQVKDS